MNWGGIIEGIAPGLFKGLSQDCHEGLGQTMPNVS